jgi:DNA replication protein DnaC
VSKSTIEEVMELSRNLPLTRNVLKATVQDATPGQLGLLADLFRAENLSREQSKRLRLLKQANFPQAKELDGYDWSTTGFPDDWGRGNLLTLDFIEHAQDLVLYGDVGCGKTHLAIALGRQACRNNIPTMFSTAAALIMTLRKAKQDNRLDRELDRIGKNRLLIIDELGYLPIDIDGARLLFQIIADSYERRSIVFTQQPRIQPVGRRVRRRRHGRSGHRPHRPPRQDHPLPRRILPQHTLTHEITKNNQGRQQPPTLHKTGATTAQIW